MKTLQSKVVVDGLVFPEGIRWHAGKVWFSDILGLAVYRYDPATRQKDVVVKTGSRPSGLGFTQDGRLLIAMMGDRKLVRLDPDGLKTVADLASVADQLNDMVVDPKGRAYMDSYVMEGGGMGGRLVMVEPDGRTRIVVEKMGLPNGLAVTPDGKSLVVSDLNAHRVLAFDIAGDGSLKNQRVFADLGDASPDGICLDTEGAAWVGLPYQQSVRRIKEGGEVTHEIAYPNKWGVAPVLGGNDRRTLFICTAEITHEQIARLMQDPHDAHKEVKGWIEAVEGIEVPGAGWP